MGDKRSTWEPVAREAVQAVERAREAGSQMELFGGPKAAPEPAWDGKGRKPGARNRGKVGLAEYMAAQGWRAPGEAMAQAAALAEDGDGLEIAFRRAVWLQQAALGALDAASDGLGAVERAAVQAAIARDLMAMTMALWKEQNACAAQLLPYTLQRLAPVEAEKPGAAVRLVAVARPAGAAGVPDDMLLAPADVRAKIEQHQGVGDGADGDADAAIRTDDASD